MAGEGFRSFLVGSLTSLRLFQFPTCHHQLFLPEDRWQTPKATFSPSPFPLLSTGRSRACVLGEQRSLPRAHCPRAHCPWAHCPPARQDSRVAQCGATSCSPSPTPRAPARPDPGRQSRLASAAFEPCAPTTPYCTLHLPAITNS